LMTNSGIGSARGSGTFSVQSSQDSTLSAVGTVLYATAAVSACSHTFASSQVKFQVATGDALALVTGAGTGGKVSAASGYVIWSGYSDNSLTARVSAIDASYTTTGNVAVFTTDNADRYLFVQGGSTDIVAKLASSDALSAGIGLDQHLWSDHCLRRLIYLSATHLRGPSGPLFLCIYSLFFLLYLNDDLYWFCLTPVIFPLPYLLSLLKL